MLSRRALLLRAVTAAGAIGVALTGCGSASSPAPAPGTTAAPAATTAAGAPAGQPTTAPAASAATAAPAAKGSSAAVHVAWFLDSGNLTYNQTYTAIGDAFTKSQQGIVVDTQIVTGDTNAQLLTQIAGGTPPDLFRYLQENIPIPALVDKKLGYALDALISRDKYDYSDFLPQAWNLNVWNGKTYGVPRDYGNQQIYYNVEMFKSAGLQPIPTDWNDTTWTFDAFVEAARKLQKTEGSRTTVWGYYVNRAWRPWATFVYSNGGAVVHKDAQGVATDIALTEDAAVGALQYIQDLMLKHKVAPRPDVESQDQLQLFSTGKVGMVLDNPSGAGNYRKNVKFEWNVGCVPVGQGGKRGSGGGGTAWAIAAPAKHPEQAWEFLKFLESPEQQRVAARAGVTTPSRKSVVHSEDFLQPGLPPAGAISFANAQEFVVRDPVHTNWPQIQKEVVNKNMDTLFDGSKDAKTVAAAIKAAADPMFKS